LREDGLPIADWVRDGRASMVKQGPHRTVYRVQLPGLSCYIKHNRIVGWRNWLRELVRGCKSVNECQKLLEISSRGVPTARPIAVGTAGGALRPGESYLIMHALEGVETLRNVAEVRLPTLPAVEATRLRFSMSDALADLLARMHDAGVRHHDLHAAN